MSGYWWRTFGLVVLINLAAALPALVITTPFNGIADNSGDAVWASRGVCRVDHCAFRGALLAFLCDLRARRRPTEAQRP